MSQLHYSSQINAVVIVAAGRGSRMGGDAGPKQYRLIGTQSVLQRTIDAFANSENIATIQVVIHADDLELYNASIKNNEKLRSPVMGGKTRQESAYEGLKAIAAEPIDNVLIHDAARPFVSIITIEHVLNEIAPGKCALPALPIADTIKSASVNEGVVRVEKTVSRENLYTAQTPQGFVFDEILNAHQHALEQNNNTLTDDSAVGESYGLSVCIVEGNRENFKITEIKDLEIANNINNLQNNVNVPNIRTGSGYDVHRLVSGDGVILCGVTIPSDKKLDGHSDADVGLHALTDALLGTIGAGDIGSHFPPSDPQWRGANSDQFLAHACKLVREHSGHITHIDVTIICEHPKIGPHREAMRAKMANICAIDLDRVSVKATTNETIGSIGRGEGIAAIATATVVLI